MLAEIVPVTEVELAQNVREALAGNMPLEILGRGSRRGWGRPVTAGRQLSLRGLDGIVGYSAAELVMTARAGTRLAEIRQVLAAERQHLAFEPPDFGPLYGTPPNEATIGGVLATNLSGPRRPFAGAARDFFLGFSGVNGRGEIVKAGGKVVKNVTGYDLPKLMAGSFGTLVALAEVTFKVVPAPERSLTLLIRGLDAAKANRTMIAASASTAEPSAAAYLPPQALQGTAVAGLPGGTGSVCAFRIEGSAASVAYRCQVLRRLLETGADVVEEEVSAGLWRSIANLDAFRSSAAGVLWLLSVPPASGAATAELLQGVFPGLRYLIDWGGGRVVAELPTASVDAGARHIRDALRNGGHASLLRAPFAQRTGDHVFTPEVPLPVLKRVREAFDPVRIFNRARLHPDL